MAKLSVARLFEVSQIATTKAFQEMQPFVEYVNQLADNLVRILVNGIGVRDNLDAQLVTLTVSADTPLSVRTNKVPIAALLVRQNPRNPLVTGFAWDIDNDGVLRIEVTFDDSAASQLDVTVLAIFS